MAKHNPVVEWGGAIGCLLVLATSVVWVLVIVWIVLDLLHKATG